MHTRLRKSLSVLLLLILISICGKSITSGKYNSQEKVTPIVSCSWLKTNLSDPGIVVLHISQIRLDYESGHIPGARFLWPGYITVSTEKESIVPAPATEVTKQLRSLGINNNSHVVLCGISGNLLTVARIFVNLEHYGLKGRVSVLDGGFDAWKAAGFEISTESPVVKKGNFRSSEVKNLVDLQFVTANLTNKAYCIIDARPKPQYDGTVGTPRQGHIPGARNLPQIDFYDPKTFVFIDSAKIIQAFRKLEIPEGSRPLFYCHTGNSASIDYIAAIIAGYDPLIYDGSMEEWASRADLPIEK